MKTLLTIGDTRFIALDATTAAKVADLLGQMQPVTEHYSSARNVDGLYAPAAYAIVGGQSHHGVRIEWMGDKREFPTINEFNEWEKTAMSGGDK